jgi:hypothetical protein
MAQPVEQFTAVIKIARVPTMKAFLAHTVRFFFVIYIHLLANALSDPAFAQPEQAREYEIKATFVYHFTKYIRWPDIDSAETFDIGILGKSEITAPLEAIARKRSVYDKRIRILYFDSIRDVDSCHLLFIPSSEKENLQEILSAVENKNILTVGESEGFARAGVAINFVILEGKTKFELNSRVIDRAGLQVSSQLVKLAILIEQE